VDLRALDNAELAHLQLQVALEVQRRLTMVVARPAVQDAGQERLTLAEYAAATGASARSLKRWAAAANVPMVAGTYTQTRAAWAALGRPVKP